MKTTATLLLACLLGANLISLPAHAASEQQNRMTTCNADAKTKALSGDARKAFMKSCLSGKASADVAATATPAASQQSKMKTCNADASKQALKGDARKQFMSSCLKSG
jgi:hypothetical protein